MTMCLGTIMKTMKEIIMVILTIITSRITITMTTEATIEAINKDSKMTSVRLVVNLIIMDSNKTLKTMQDKAITTSVNLDTMMVASIKRPRSTLKNLPINHTQLLKITLPMVFHNLVLMCLLKPSSFQPHKLNSWTSRRRRKLFRNLTPRKMSRPTLRFLPLS